MSDNQTKSLPLNDAIETIWSYCQRCVQSNPTLVVGSGASAAYDLPTMPELAAVIVKQIESEEHNKKAPEIWQRFVSMIEKSGLEKALDESGLWQNDLLYRAVTEITWNEVSKKEKTLYLKSLVNENYISFSQYFSYIFSSINDTCKIVTTNYDRIIEFAAEANGYFIRTGFNPGMIGLWRRNEPPLRFWSGDKRRPEKIVELWKVHGSLGWFELEQGRILSLQTFGEIPYFSTPLIVPPSIKKHSQTHNEPFRTMLYGADQCLQSAEAIICIGYGFNDEHIQPNLVSRIIRDGKPCIILARTISERTRTLIIENTRSNFVAFESNQRGGTTIYSSMFDQEYEIEALELWQFSGFITEILGA